MLDLYQNPLLTRYASKGIAELFGDNNRIRTWRLLWTTLAECQQELGLDISDKQIAELRQYQNDINWDAAYERERVVRHDVMAHVFAYGLQAKSAAPIIHLGATSCFVTDNADIIIFDKAIRYIKTKLLGVIEVLSRFATDNKDIATLGYTHLQAAQLTTVGKRATLWINDLVDDYSDIQYLLDNIRLRGAKGTTGTQASFLALFDNDHDKVKRLDALVASRLGYDKTVAVCGQTYSRKFDYKMLSVLSSIAQSSYKFASDIRHLQSMREIEEPFEHSQIGSSAMAYKRNPMRSERLCSLARFVINTPINASQTETAQWLERTLDDSAIRRIVLPQAFLALDGVLSLYLNIAGGLVVNKSVIASRVDAELPFMATENILMECVKLGGNRQELHEVIREHSMDSADKIKHGSTNDLIDKLKKDKHFAGLANKWSSILSPKGFVGRADVQTAEFVRDIVRPILDSEQGNICVDNDIRV